MKPIKQTDFPTIHPSMAMLINTILHKSLLWDIQLNQQEFRIRLKADKHYSSQSLAADSLIESDEKALIVLNLAWQDTSCIAYIKPALISTLLEWDHIDFDITQLTDDDLKSLFDLMLLIFNQCIDQNTATDIKILAIDLMETAKIPEHHPIALTFKVNSVEHFSCVYVFFSESHTDALLEWIGQHDEASTQSTLPLSLPITFSLIKLGCHISATDIQQLALGDILLMDGPPNLKEWDILLDQQHLYRCDADGQLTLQPSHAPSSSHSSFTPKHYPVHLSSDTFSVNYQNIHALVSKANSLRDALPNDQIIMINQQLFARGHEIQLGNRWGIMIDSFL